MSKKKQKKYYAKRAAAAKAASNPHQTAAKSKPKKKQVAVPYFDSNNVYEILARLFLFAMVIVFPLAMGEEKYSNITHFKNTTYYVIAALAFSAVIIALIVRMMKIPTSQFQADKIFKNVLNGFNIVDKAVLLYWGFLLISALLSDYTAVSFFGQGVRNDGLIIQTFYVATYFMLSKAIRLRPFDMHIYCYGATAVALLVIFHFFGIDFLNTGYSEPNWKSGLLFMGPMGNINLSSYFVTVGIILAAALYITEQHVHYDKRGYIILACFAFMLWAELNLNTDAGIVAIGIALLVSLPMVLISFRRLGRMFTVLAVSCGVILCNRIVVDVNILGEKFGKLGFIIISAGVICAVLAVLINTDLLKFNPSRKTMLISTLTVDGMAVVAVFAASFAAAKTQTSGVLYELGQMMFHGNFDDMFGTKRLFTWKRALKLALDKPIFGNGPDTFCNVFKEAYSEEVSEMFDGRNLDKAHNEYLQLLICSGVTGLGSFLVFIGSMITRAFRRAMDNPMLVCCAMGIVGYAVHAFFGYSLPINSPLMWVLFGLAGAAMRIPTEDAD